MRVQVAQGGRRMPLGEREELGKDEQTKIREYLQLIVVGLDASDPAAGVDDTLLGGKGSHGGQETTGTQGESFSAATKRGREEEEEEGGREGFLYLKGRTIHGFWSIDLQ